MYFIIKTDFIIHGSLQVSDENVFSNDPPKLLSYSSQKFIQMTGVDSTGESGALESGQFGLPDESRSLSSESLRFALQNYKYS